MENKKNYHKELEKIIESIKAQQTLDEKGRLTGEKKTVFLHSCCAPCSSYCMEYLRQYFSLTVFYYNPNIMMPDEYRKRADEQKRLIEAYNQDASMEKIQYCEGEYDPACFRENVRGLEECPERGERCMVCYRLRLLETAKWAKKNGMDYFTTTLTLSPLKDAQKINEIGQEIANQMGVPFLPCDFKKNNGYLRSIELSKQYGLYRQNYCGCEFSKQQRKSIGGNHEKNFG